MKYHQILFSVFKVKHQLKIHLLSENQKWLEQASIWSEIAWGYMSELDYADKKYIKEIAKDFYILTYANQPIGMFGLPDEQSFQQDIKIKYLMYVYVDPNFRSLGIGGQLIEFAKQIAKEKNIDLIMFYTVLNKLNKFYIRNGAREVCETQFVGDKSSLISHPATLLRI